MTTETVPSVAPAPAPVHSRGNRKQARRNTLIGWTFILPNFLGFLAFTLIPVTAAFALSFMEWTSFTAPRWVGLENFQRMFQSDTFWVALRNTVVYALGHVPLTMALALLLAMLLNRKLKGIGFFRVAIFFPYITSLVAVAVVWNTLFSPDTGPINQFLNSIGIAEPPGWTSSSDWAMPAVIITSVWRDMGYYMVLYLAGLQAIPSELYEAASLDGAGVWKSFTTVTMPFLRPFLYATTFLEVIWVFKAFVQVFTINGGGPDRLTEILPVYAYIEGVGNQHYGMGAAIAVLTILIMLGLTAYYLRIVLKQEEDEL